MRVLIREQMDQFIYALYVNNVRFGKLPRFTEKAFEEAAAAAESKCIFETTLSNVMETSSRCQLLLY